MLLVWVFFPFPALESVATTCKRQGEIYKHRSFQDWGHGGESWRILILLGWADFGSRWRAFITGLGSLWWSALLKMLLGPCKVMCKSGCDFVLAESSSNVVMLSCTKQDLAVLLTDWGHQQTVVIAQSRQLFFILQLDQTQVHEWVNSTGGCRDISCGHWTLLSFWPFIKVLLGLCKRAVLRRIRINLNSFLWHF